MTAAPMDVEHPQGGAGSSSRSKTNRLLPWVRLVYVLSIDIWIHSKITEHGLTVVIILMIVVGGKV